MLQLKTEKKLIPFVFSIFLALPLQLQANDSVDLTNTQELTDEASPKSPDIITVDVETQTSSLSVNAPISETTKKTVEFLKEHYPVVVVEKTTLIQAQAYSETLILVGAYDSNLIPIPDDFPPLPIYFIDGKSNWKSAAFKAITATLSTVHSGAFINQYVNNLTSSPLGSRPRLPIGYSILRDNWFPVALTLSLPIAYWVGDSILRRIYDLENHQKFEWNRFFPMGKYRNRTAADQTASLISEHLADRGYWGEKIIIIKRPYFSRTVSQLIQKHGYILLNE